MARSPNCTGAPLFKGRVDVSITYPDPNETLLDTQQALPTSEPATPQVEIEITSAMLPVWSPYELGHKNLAILFDGGWNAGSVTRTTYYRLLKNGVSVATGSYNVLAGDYYTHEHRQFPSVELGDVIACKLWASNTGVYYDYKAAVVYPTRICAGYGPMMDLLLVLGAAKKLTKGSPGSSAPTGYYLTVPGATSVYADCIYAAEGQADYDTQVSAGAWVPHATRGLGYPYGDGRYINTRGSTFPSLRPYHALHSVPTRIAYTPLNLRV